MSKWIQCIAIMCIVISISLCPFFSVSAISGQAYSNAYMPVCSDYPSSSQLPYGEDLTQVVCLKTRFTSSTRYDWFFVSGSFTNFDGASSYEIENALSFIVSSSSNIGYYLVTFYSHSIIKRVTQFVYDSDLTTTTRDSYNTFQSNASAYVANIEVPYNTTTEIISTCGYLWIGYPVDVAIGKGQLSSSNLITPYYIASYPDTVQQAITSIQDNSFLLSQYYTSLNSRLNSLSIDLRYVQGQNDELSSKVDELQSLLGAQSGEYQSALNQAQSEIQSNANSAAQSAADDVNNAGSDVDDLDDNMDDVNGIVETLDGWIEDLDDFADSIDDSITSVSVALTNANAVINGFFGACPPIVLALFGFALVFIVVRKIIGR